MYACMYACMCVVVVVYLFIYFFLAGGGGGCLEIKINEVKLQTYSRLYG